MTRYTRSNGYNAVMRSNRYKPIIIIVLVLLAAFLIFKLAGVGGINEGNFEAQRNTRLRSEVQHAISSVNSRRAAKRSISTESCSRSCTDNCVGRTRSSSHASAMIARIDSEWLSEIRSACLIIASIIS